MCPIMEAPGTVKDRQKTVQDRQKTVRRPSKDRQRPSKDRRKTVRDRFFVFPFWDPQIDIGPVDLFVLFWTPNNVEFFFNIKIGLL